MATSPQSNVTNLHISGPLSDFALGYHPTGFIAEDLFNVMPVNFENDLYYEWLMDQAFRIERSDGYGTLRADGTPAREEDYGALPHAYKAEEFALKTKITDRQRRNADKVLDLERSKTRRVMDKILLDQELRVAGLAGNAANYASSNKITLAGTSQWNNASFASQTTSTQSVIQQVVDNAKEAIRIATGGLEANTIVLPPPVERVVARDVGVMQQLEYVTSNLTSSANRLGATLWGLNVLRPRASYTVSVEGETATYNDVWGKNVVICYRDPAPAIDSQTFGMIMRNQPQSVRSWREEAIKSWYYEASMVQAELFIAKGCGYLISAAVA